MRVDLARALLSEDELIVFDEFTSLLDRTVARNLCIAISKAVKMLHKKFIAVTCHYDVAQFLQADWNFDTFKMSMFSPKARDTKNLQYADVNVPSGNILCVITI